MDPAGCYGGMIAAMGSPINRPDGLPRAAPTLNSRQGGAARRRMEFSGDIKGL
ncbi:MAG: hypothetical protein ACI9P3_000455 [Bradyrhizobium sp.]|jgi:hypothetical protein